MSNLLESLAAGFSGDEFRRTLLDEALRDGLPGPRAEAWKYTSLRRMERRQFAPVEQAPAVDAAIVADIPTPRVVFVDGQLSRSLSDTVDLSAGVSLSLLSDVLASGEDADRFLQRRFEHNEEVFARLNLALANEGVLLRVDSDVQCESPIHWVFISSEDDTDRAWHLRHHVEVRDGAAITLIEHHLSAGQAAPLANSLIRLHVGERARLTHLRIQNDSERATHLLRTDASLAARAVYRRVDLELGSVLSRHELNVRLEGDHAALAAHGVLLGDGSRHLDTRLGIEHVAKNTQCDLNWRGLGDARGRVVFHGSILIQPGADGTDARLSNKNLLLSSEAEVDTQPVLEIYADEVQAAHGATVGQLDSQSLFYLRSRGIPEAQAQRLLIKAFCREPVLALEEASLRDSLLAAIETRLLTNEEPQG